MLLHLSGQVAWSKGDNSLHTPDGPDGHSDDSDDSDVPSFSPFVDNGSHRGSLESQSLRNGFVTLSTLIDVSDFISHPFGKFFRWRHDVLLFRIFQTTSLCQTAST